jgi:hypothetical protein
MLDGFDQLELLSLIEGELSPEDVQVLRDQLAARPDALAVIDQMIGDRAAMQSLPNPELPRNFLENLEPLIARPMLMGTTPGSYRRRHHRFRRTRRLRRALVAACLTMMIGGASWIIVRSVTNPASPQNDRLAANDGAQPDAATPPVPTNDTPTMLAGNTARPDTRDAAGIFHAPPAQGERETLVAALMADPAGRTRAGQPRNDDAPVVAPFALVLTAKADDLAALESQLAVALTSNRLRVTAVRNFSFEEAVALADASFRVHESRSNGEQPLTASTDRSSSSRTWQSSDLAQRLQSLRREQPAASDPADMDPVLVGDDDQAPSLSTQLEFSRRGAALTISIPVMELETVLAEIAQWPGLASYLAMLPPREPGELVTSTPVSDAFVDLAAVRQAMQDLPRDGHGRILLPVVLKDASADQ